MAKGKRTDTAALADEDPIAFGNGRSEVDHAEHFGLSWPGKRAARMLANAPSAKQLVAQPGKGLNEKSTSNIFIEGDNLEVLKILKKDYTGKVKTIYIDPPYNTGKDMGYADDLSETRTTYAQRSDHANGAPHDAHGDGRYHSQWLSMMYPRLILARELLRDDGVIFVSIDNNEVHYLRVLMAEVFGDANSVDLFAWVKTETPANLSKKSKKVVEYVVCYQKVKNGERFRGIHKYAGTANTVLNQSNKVGKLVFPKNVVTTKLPDGKLAAGTYGSKSYTVELLADTEVKKGFFVKPIELQARFRWSQKKLDEEIAQGTFISIPTRTFSVAYTRSDYAPEVPPNLINSAVGVGTNENGSAHLKALFGAKVFDFPKPVSLINYLLGFQTPEPNDIILDFFAGSGTTGEAVDALMQEDGVPRRWILVQLPEALSADHPARAFNCTTYADVCRERLIRAFKKSKSKSGFTSYTVH
ncbi:MAG: site-specific DNA-methyltransferase [Flavobacteriales bacterium]|nr:site-specific DNA-methyltransferase [Flavobacteriales bacterium]